MYLDYLSPFTLGPLSGGVKIAMLRATVDKIKRITKRAIMIPFLFLFSDKGDKKSCHIYIWWKIYAYLVAVFLLK